MPTREVVSDIDHGYRQLMRELKRANNSAVTIGVQGKQASASTYKETGASNLQIAATHELGDPARKVPKRSFLQGTLDAEMHRYRSMTTVLLAKVVNSKGQYKTRKALGLLGARIRADVRDTLKSGIAPELALSTIRWRARKRRVVAREISKLRKAGFALKDIVGHFTPLLDTGTLVRSVTWKVRKGFRGEAGSGNVDEEAQEDVLEGAADVGV